MKDYDLANEVNELDIAVIGMSGRFPGANNIDEFWQNLCAGKESISFFSEEELEASGTDPAILNDPNYVKAAPVLDNADMFDASFFGYSAKEARFMDPQHRLFLECAWEALEYAGYDANSYLGAIGVFAGSAINTYLLSSDLGSYFFIDPLSTMIGNDKDFLTTRVSYKLNLRGPSVAVQTACSTSLVAVHLASQSLLTGECDMALAGGVTVRTPLKAGHFYREGSIHSPDGHCRAFDAKAQGTIFGSGVGIVVLKRLEDAIADGDHLHAVIKGSAINNDGASKVDYTAPSVNSQSEAILQALANAGLEADKLSYIEAHGTGTTLGDPIEIAALTNAFRTYTDKKGFCAVGSVKTNIGHLDAAAGIAGLIKTTLALKHKMIPPSLHFEKANPAIDFENAPFYVNSVLTEWRSDLLPRRAGVSSLGVGGTNAHVILEEASVLEPPEKSRSWQILLLSAKTSTALDTMTTNLVGHFKQHPHLNLADVAYTLQIGRKSFNHRRMAVCRDLDDAVTTLETLEPQRVITAFQEPINRDIVFMLSGQGSQYINMGLELYRAESIFRKCIDRCSEILQPHLSFDLCDVLYPDERNAEEATQNLKQTYITQPALFVIEYALAELWMSWGVHPQVLVGHSIGEYVAACLAGVFSLQDALALVATRGRLMQELPGGSMLAVFLSEKEMRPFLDEKLSVAVVNGPSACVVSGEITATEDLEKYLSRKNVDCRPLHTSHAFHSKMMIPMIETFVNKVRQVTLNPPQIPFVSNVTGTWITSDEAMDPAYWARHARQTVRFSDCMQELLKEPNRVFLEVGPGRTLSVLARQHPNRTNEHLMLSSIRHPTEQKSDLDFILNTVGRLWLAGIQIDWSGLYADEYRHRLPLPTYPFERKRYWLSTGKQSSAAAAATAPSSSEEPEEASLADRTHSRQEIDMSYDGAARDRLERSLAEIWQEVLGAERVRTYDDFFDLGGSSLLAMEMFSKINEEFGKKLPLATLYETPKLEQLANVLREEQGTLSWDSLVEIQTGGSNPPFYCVHAAGGNVLIYRDLARHLGPDQPVYGLQSQGLDGEQPLLTRIEDMAALYLREIQTIQPEGPYLLGGYCMGGTVALEMAQQLRGQNKQVALLALFETYNWENMNLSSFVDVVLHRFQQIDFHLRNFMLLDSKRRLLFLREKMKVAKHRSKVYYGKMMSRFSHRHHRHNGKHLLPAKLWETNDSAALRYVPEVYSGRITHFRAMKDYACFPGPGSDLVSEEGVAIHTLPVYPRGMLVEPFVEQLAEELKDCIDKALRSASISESVDSRQQEDIDRDEIRVQT